MVNSQTVGIERGRIGKASVELCHSSCNVVRPVGHGISIKERLRSRRRGLTSVEIGHSGKRSSWKSKPKPFIRKEEKGPVSTIVSGLTTAFAKARQDHRTAESPAEVILPLFWLRQSFAVGEPVIGIQNVIPQIIERSAVKLIRA